jgi:hypothetical protein
MCAFPRFLRKIKKIKYFKLDEVLRGHIYEHPKYCDDKLTFNLYISQSAE